MLIVVVLIVGILGLTAGYILGREQHHAQAWVDGYEAGLEHGPDRGRWLRLPDRVSTHPVRPTYDGSPRWPHGSEGEYRPDGEAWDPWT